MEIIGQNYWDDQISIFIIFLFFLFIYIKWEKWENEKNPNSSDIHCFTICERLKTWPHAKSLRREEILFARKGSQYVKR